MFLACAVLVLAALAYVGTDRYFAILEDETTIVAVARQPLGEMLASYRTADWPLSHPPLAEIILHAWLPVGGHARWSLRILGVAFYFCGLLVLGLAARRLAGPRAFAATLAIGLPWPLAFHFARAAAWYSLFFLLVALLSLAYVAYVESGKRWLLAGFATIAFALVCTGYHGWAVLACLAFDYYMFSARSPRRWEFAAMLAAVAVAYFPLWTAMGSIVATEALESESPLASRALVTLYHFHTLFVSESVAPWFWYLSVPAGLAAACVVRIAMTQPSSVGRRFLAYFFILFAGMAAFDILSPKRLLGISPWLLLSIAVCASETGRGARRIALLGSLATVAAIGWYGTVARGYYASLHFMEPWDDIARRAMPVVGRGGVVASNSLSLLFELNYALHDSGLAPDAPIPGWASHPNVVAIEDGKELPRLRQSKVLLVRGVNVGGEEAMARAGDWLMANCKLLATARELPDRGYVLKQRFFPGYSQVPYRIVTSEFDCAR